MVGEGLRREPLRRTAKRTINDDTHVKRRTDYSFLRHVRICRAMAHV